MTPSRTALGMAAIMMLLAAAAFFAVIFLPAGGGRAANVEPFPTATPPPVVEKVGALPDAFASASAGGGQIVYNPPKLEDAPEEIRASVQRGYAILMDPQKEVPEHVGNEMKCRNCHFNAGLTEGGKGGGLTLVGTAATYPKYRARQEHSVDLTVRVNDCFERSENGKALAPGSRDMTDILTYFKWISKDIPIYGDVPWLGLHRIESDYKGDATAGQQVYSAKCAACHGQNGEGTPAAPPVWGDGAYNDGAGMARPETLASFALLNMPLGNPDLTEAQAFDVAQFVDTQPRPKFVPVTPPAGG
jgi:thiosulfate dehydrogenase